MATLLFTGFVTTFHMLLERLVRSLLSEDKVLIPKRSFGRRRKWGKISSAPTFIILPGSIRVRFIQCAVAVLSFRNRQLSRKRKSDFLRFSLKHHLDDSSISLWIKNQTLVSREPDMFVPGLCGVFLKWLFL